jgi:hypothetical protein
MTVVPRRSVAHVPTAQDGQLLRDRRGRHADRILELAHAAWALPKQLEDADPKGVREGLEELGLELAKAVWIVGRTLRILVPGRLAPARAQPSECLKQPLART